LFNSFKRFTFEITTKNAMKKIFILFGFFLLLTPVIHSQNSDAVISTDSPTKKYIYQYGFENASSEEAVKSAETIIGKLVNVSEVKYQFKTDSNRGQFIVTVIEKERSSESEEQFSPKMMKDAMLQNGLNPIDFTVTEEIIK
jgi:hypothetical protein